MQSLITFLTQISDVGSVFQLRTISLNTFITDLVVEMFCKK